MKFLKASPVLYKALVGVYFTRHSSGASARRREDFASMACRTSALAACLALVTVSSATLPTAQHAAAPRTLRSPLAAPCGGPAAALALRGGANIGPVTPPGMIYINAATGLLYSVSLLGLDPMLPDPTRKYWQQEETPATKAILQFFSLALVWTNGFMIYAMLSLGASAADLLKFQTFGWASSLLLNFWQVARYGFTAQLDTLGLQITLAALTAYMGFRA